MSRPVSLNELENSPAAGPGWAGSGTVTFFEGAGQFLTGRRSPPAGSRRRTVLDKDAGAQIPSPLLLIVREARVHGWVVAVPHSLALV